MNIRLLKSQDTHVLEEYLAPHKAECMFICSNLKAAGIEYKGADFEGEYFGYFDINDQLQGVIVHYWNGNVMMHSKDHDVLENLISHLKKNISRQVADHLRASLYLWTNPLVDYETSELDFDFASLKSNKETIYIVLKTSDIERLAHLFNALIL